MKTSTYSIAFTCCGWLGWKFECRIHTQIYQNIISSFLLEKRQRIESRLWCDRGRIQTKPKHKIERNSLGHTVAILPSICVWKHTCNWRRAPTKPYHHPCVRWENFGWRKCHKCQIHRNAKPYNEYTIYTESACNSHNTRILATQFPQFSIESTCSTTCSAGHRQDFGLMDNE